MAAAVELATRRAYRGRTLRTRHWTHAALMAWMRRLGQQGLHLQASCVTVRARGTRAAWSRCIGEVRPMFCGTVDLG
jgi:hypothetical protein